MLLVCLLLSYFACTNSRQVSQVEMPRWKLLSRNMNVIAIAILAFKPVNFPSDVQDVN